eukprot:scaffold1947_cov207-Prasinococcus_capsulatus_cf.AAC.25
MPPALARATGRASASIGVVGCWRGLPMRGAATLSIGRREPRRRARAERSRFLARRESCGCLPQESIVRADRT